MNSLNIFFPLTGLINCLTSIILGIFVYTRNRKDPRNIVYSLFCLSIAVWSFFYFLWLIADNAGSALFFIHVLMSGVIFIPGLYLHYLFLFLGVEKANRKIILFCYGFSLIALVLSYLPQFISGVSSRPGFQFWPDAGVLFQIIMVLWVGIVFYGAAIIMKEYLRASGSWKVKVRYVLIATMIGWIGGATNFPSWFGINVMPVGNILVSMYVGITTYAIVRHRLMNIRVMAAKTFIFLLVYLPILLVPFILRDYLVYLHWTIPIIYEAIFASLGLLLFLRTQSRAEKQLLKMEYKYRALIKKIADRIVRIQDINEGSKYIADGLFEGIDIGHISVYVIDRNDGEYLLRAQKGVKQDVKALKPFDQLIRYMIKDRQLIVCDELSIMNVKVVQSARALKATVIVPVVGEKELLGLIVIGSNQKDKIYSEIEIESLNDLSTRTALMIENVLSFDEKQGLKSKLMETQRMAEIGYLANAMGHQIKNNLNIFLVKIQALQMNEKFSACVSKEDGLKSVVDETLESVCSLGFDCAKIIRELKEYSQPRKNDDLNEDVVLQNVLDKALEMAKLRYKGVQAEVEIIKELPDENMVVIGSNLQLQNVMINIINNSYDAIIAKSRAVDVNEEYKGKINITLSQQNNDYEMHFIDNGIGIKKGYLDQIFAIPMFTTKGSEELRQRRGDSDSGITGGTGIGTYMVNLIVTAHNGEIGIHKAEEGKGTDIVMRLPGKE